MAMQHPSRRSATLAHKGGLARPSSARAAALQAVQDAHRYGTALRVLRIEDQGSGQPCCLGGVYCTQTTSSSC